MTYILNRQENGLYLEPTTERIYEQNKNGFYILLADLKKDVLIREPNKDNLEQKINI